jgi:hypothetical protein
MVLVLLVVAFVIVSTLLVIAAGILSSRLSRQEEWYETYEAVDTDSAETIPQTSE